MDWNYIGELSLSVFIFAPGVILLTFAVGYGSVVWTRRFFSETVPETAKELPHGVEVAEEALKDAAEAAEHALKDAAEAAEDAASAPAFARIEDED